MTFGAGGLPPEVASLAQLRRFCWVQGPLHSELAVPLPAGPWLASLREAALEVAVVEASLAVLQAGAPQLEELAVDGRFGDGARQLAVARWAGERPSLRRLAFCKGVVCVARHATELSEQELSDAVRALRLRPTLAIECSDALLRQVARLRHKAAEVGTRGGGASPAWPAPSSS